MFHPVGNQPPSVYWRRRLVVLGSLAMLLVLIAVTIRTLASGDGGAASAGGGAASTSNSPSVTRPASQTTASTSASPRPSTTPAGSKHSRTSAAPPPRCTHAQLAVAAAVDQSHYQVGDKPVVELQVTNTGSAPCVQDLADKQVELRIYNGESRVWGSHDCEVQPGTSDRTLLAGHPIRVRITWSGLTSHPNCAGTRLRVGAGTYTLYASLSGKTGTAAQFSIS